MPKLLLLSLALLSCGRSHWEQFPAEHCPQNQCLIWLGLDRPDGWGCEDLGKWEGPIVSAYAKNLKGKWAVMDVDKICDRLRGFRTFIAHGETFELFSWLGMPRQTVYGATECWAQVMKVGNSKTNSAIFHEAGHAISQCYPPGGTPADGEDYAHAGWEALGFGAAEKEARLNAN